MEKRGNSTDTTQGTVEIIFSHDVTLVYYSVTITIILCACALNLMSIYMYLTRKIRRTNFNFCLLHLAVSNTVQQIAFIPFIAVENRDIKSEYWYLESIQCGFVDGLSVFFMAAFVTVYIICFMSVNWYRIIKKPFASKQTRKYNILRYVTILWTIGSILIAPNFLTWKLDYKHGFCVRSEVFGHNFAFFYKGFLLLVGLIIPVITMCFTYILIIRSMCQRRANKKEKFKSPTKERYRKKVIKHIERISS